MKYIVLKGAGHVGKTTTLWYLNKMLKGGEILEYDFGELNFCKDIVKNRVKDFIVIYKNYKGKKVAIISAGDVDDEIRKSVKLVLSLCKDIDIIFCANRLYRRGKDYFNEIKDKKIEILKGYFYGTDDKMIQEYHKHIAEFLYEIAFDKNNY